MSDIGLTPRLKARIARDFPDTGSAVEVEQLLAGVESSNQGRERVLAAVLFCARGDHRRLVDAIELTRIDWRDVLVAGGVGNEGWPEVLDAELGPTS